MIFARCSFCQPVQILVRPIYFTHRIPSFKLPCLKNTQSNKPSYLRSLKTCPPTLETKTQQFDLSLWYRTKYTTSDVRWNVQWESLELECHWTLLDGMVSQISFQW